MHLRYRAASWAIGSAVMAVACRAVLRNYTLSYGPRVVLSLVPVAAMSVFCVLAVKIVRGLDEMETRIHLEGALYGLLGTALLTMSTGLLSKEGIFPPVTMAVAWPWLWTVAFLLWGAGTFIAGARYR